MTRALRIGTALGAGLSLLALVGCGVPTLGTGAVDGGSLEASATLNPLKALVLRDAKDSFSAYDDNHDGVLTHAEVPFMRSASFDALDANHDGRITWQESAPTGSQLKVLLESSAKALTQLFTKLDKNGDHTLEASERAAADYLVTGPGESADLTFDGFVAALERGATNVYAERVVQSDRPPVVMVPGWFLPTAIWIPLAKKLKDRGYVNQITVPHWPSFGDIRDYAAAAAYRTQRIQAQTGAKHVEAIGHSMGGLVLRYFIKHLGGDQVVSHYVSFGTPQHGTVIGKLWPCTSTDQMLPGSDFLTELNAGDETPSPVKYTSIRTNTDEIVLSETSPILEGAENFLVPTALHLEMVWDPRAQKIALEALTK
ncbi:MAG TPA: alpha/beta fold hydrolase [Stenomitos sp.]